MTNTHRQQVHLTIEEVYSLAAEWQAVLRLQDWTVTFKLARGNGLDLPEQTQGRCQFILARKEALIKLCNPIDFPSDTSSPQDMEATLVHELLHLHFAPFDNFRADSAEDTAMEQTLNALSHAFVQLKRSR